MAFMNAWHQYLYISRLKGVLEKKVERFFQSFVRLGPIQHWFRWSVFAQSITDKLAILQ